MDFVEERAFKHEGVHLTRIRTFTYRTGLAPINDFDVAPLNAGYSGFSSSRDSWYDDLWRRGRGVAVVLYEPIYRVERREPLGKYGHVTLVGEPSNGGNDVPYLKDDYLADLKAGQDAKLEARKAIEAARIEGNARKVADLEATFPDYPSLVGTEYSDGTAFSGDHSDDVVTPRLPFDFLGISCDHVFVDEAERHYWIGRVFHANAMGGRNDDEVAQAIGDYFGCSARSVYRYAKEALESNRSYGTIKGSKSKVRVKRFLPVPMEGDWDLASMNPEREPWATCDGERSYGEWGYDGPTDLAMLKRRAMLDHA